MMVSLGGAVGAVKTPSGHKSMIFCGGMAPASNEWPSALGCAMALGATKPAASAVPMNDRRSTVILAPQNGGHDPEFAVPAHAQY